ncbi:MAG: hypothetical protein R3286_08820 [Gammaproteobacteria bacterium]|nr:hypothetical protein [Gammaproteobacteria bacterium]
MSIDVTHTRVRSILTRTSGYLKSIASHSLQPYRGCSFGASLCGVGCYVRHNAFVTRGRPWGTFLEVRDNAAETYLAQHAREQRWGRESRGRFAVFMSSSTDPFVPHERRFRVTRALLEAMVDAPPDTLVVQTHTHLAETCLEPLAALAARCELRVHVSVESDRDRLPGLPPPASPVARRLAAAARFRAAGVRSVVTVAPLLPIEDPWRFFSAIAAAADAVVVDHFIGGDGSRDGARTLATALPGAMAAVAPRSVHLAYRDEMVALAQRIMPGRVGVGIDGFAGRLLPAPATARGQAAVSCAEC